ncbi:MAG: NADH-quinone oxidoreductase subunit L, partial [Candidatus Omnitrophica bacterium]|nr:NADH-quinone oxidoreductase subunit L [Candidatus Omnitrophota bacterium]
MILLFPILLPLVLGVVVLFIKNKFHKAIGSVSLAAAAVNFILALILFKANLAYRTNWLSFGVDFSLRLYNFSGLILLCVAFFGLLVTLYSLVFMRGKSVAKQFYAYLLITLSFINGALLSGNLLLLFFFWEGLLITILAMIMIGGKQSFKTATKAFIIVGVSDLCMMI